MGRYMHLKILDQFSHLPRFPDGRINHTGQKEAPVISCFVIWQGKLLLLRRSNKVANYQGKWDVVCGYIDEDKPLVEKMMEELSEKIGLKKDDIDRVTVGNIFRKEDRTSGRAWIVHPVLVKLKRLPNVVLDWEHTEYVWIPPEQLKDYDIVPGLDESWKKIEIKN